MQLKKRIVVRKTQIVLVINNLIEKKLLLSKKIESLEYENVVNLESLEECIEIEDRQMLLIKESKEKRDSLNRKLSKMIKIQEMLAGEIKKATELLKN